VWLLFARRSIQAPEIERQVIAPPKLGRTVSASAPIASRARRPAPSNRVIGPGDPSHARVNEERPLPGPWTTSYAANRSEVCSKRVAPIPGHADACQGDEVRIGQLPVSTNSSTPTELVDIGFALCVESEEGRRVVRLTGELDIANRDLVRRTCLEGNDVAVVVDMSDLVFIDCCGYGALIAARRILTDLGGSLVIHNQSGQPAFLLSLLSDLAAAQLHRSTRDVRRACQFATDRDRVEAP
jgi:anti-anti-sigma factor